MGIEWAATLPPSSTPRWISVRYGHISREPERGVFQKSTLSRMPDRKQAGRGLGKSQCIELWFRHRGAR